MKKQPRIVTLLLVLLLPLFILSSCQEAQTTEESQATHTSTAIMVPSAYPAPQEPGRTETTMQITSGPVSTEISTDTYPGPEAGAPTNMPVEAYPQPGSQATPAQGATQMVGMAPTPTLLGAFPAPEPTQNQGNEPYPGPTNDSGLATPASSVQPTFAGTAPARGVTPTVTPTLGLLRTELTASDPRSFHIASGEVQLVEFFAFWSPESQGMAAVMNVLEQRYKDRLRFVYLDIDDSANSLFKTLMKDRLPPVFFLIDGQGVVLHEWQGYVEPGDFEAAFAELVP